MTFVSRIIPTIVSAFILSTVWLCAPIHAAQPSLPAGLNEESATQPASGPGGQGPALPGGLEEGPSLPSGLGEEPATEKPETAPEDGKLVNWLDLAGFWEVRGGIRPQSDRHEKDASLGETRLQLEMQKAFDGLTAKVTADFVYDPVLDHHSINLGSGQGWLDLREVYIAFSPLKFMDVKVGRQILTWGTGDLVFINDLFPKDWQAFFIGRDMEYLKAPSDAAKFSFFTDWANVDVVFTPRFDPDRYIRGRRISYWSNTLGRRVGQDAVVDADEPSGWFNDSEWAVRVSKNIRGYELAAYGYWGYWKSPAGFDPARSRATFPRLGVYGASARGQFAGGIANVEAGYYDSRQDADGDNPFIDNGQVRMLLGYERDLPRIAKDLKLGVQYYVELMTDYGQYRRNLPAGMMAKDHARHMITLRITKLLMNQDLTLSLFAFYSPTDGDAYIRPNVRYKIDDHWTAEIGGNVFFGADNHTFFGQFGRNSNIYAALRYGF